MSQVDYIHFFSNVVWSSTLLCVIYCFICVFYFQNFYKMFRLRKLFFNNIIFISKFYNIILSNYLNWNINNLDFLKGISKKGNLKISINNTNLFNVSCT